MANFEVECFSIVAGGLLHVLPNRIPPYLAYLAFFSDHKQGILGSRIKQTPLGSAIVKYNEEKFTWQAANALVSQRDPPLKKVGVLPVIPHSVT